MKFESHPKAISVILFLISLVFAVVQYFLEKLMSQSILRKTSSRATNHQGLFMKNI